MNTFFKRHPKRKWTWKSPNNVSKNEIDYILVSDKSICMDVSVLNRFDTGSDHRLVRARIWIDTSLGRKRWMEKKTRLTMGELRGREEEYSTQIEKKLCAIEELQELELNELSNKITNSIRTALKKVCSLRRQRNAKISLDTQRQIEERRRTDRDSPRYKELNKAVKKALRKNQKAYTTHLVNEAMANNMNMIVLRVNLSRGKLRIHKMKNEQDEVVTDKNEIAAVIKGFYRRLYSQISHLADRLNQGRTSRM